MNTVLGALVLPPTGPALFALAGLLLARRRPRLGLALCLVSLLALLAVSTPTVARLLAASLERQTEPLTSARARGAQAIVVLGGGRVRRAPEYGGRDIPSVEALPRLRYAARLQRETGLPLLVSGGAPEGYEESEASIMARALREDFRVPVQWLEGESDNTAQNAQFSARLLRQAGVRRVLLVTDAVHMPRAQAMFALTGMESIPAPTIFFSRKEWDPVDLVPGKGITLARYALHEWLGLAWYRMRYGAAD